MIKLQFRWIHITTGERTISSVLDFKNSFTVLQYIAKKLDFEPIYLCSMERVYTLTDGHKVYSKTLR